MNLYIPDCQFLIIVQELYLSPYCSKIIKHGFIRKIDTYTNI